MTASLLLQGVQGVCFCVLSCIVESLRQHVDVERSGLYVYSLS